MARLNIEQAWWGDPRRAQLMIKLGCQFKADGAMVNAWNLAGPYWVPEKRLIPVKAWQEAGLPDALFECSLAERRGEFVYVRGIEHYFEWRFQKAEAGRKGGNAKAAGGKRSTAKQGRSTAKQDVASYSPSGSSSRSESVSNSEVVGGDNSAVADVATTGDSDLDAICSEKKITPKHWNSWCVAYPDTAWVTREIKRLYAWEGAASGNKKRNFSLFVTRCLGKSWDTRPRNLPPPPVAPIGAISSRDAERALWDADTPCKAVSV